MQIGIDVGATKIEYILLHENGEETNRSRIDCPKDYSSIIKSIKCKKAIKIANNLVRGKGRMLVRKSGTEPKIRIMGESENKALLTISILSLELKR